MPIGREPMINTDPIVDISSPSAQTETDNNLTTEKHTSCKYIPTCKTRVHCRRGRACNSSHRHECTSREELFEHLIIIILGKTTILMQ
jgi:sulfatase maturation enzyme AslB (radical SAM superfamily)